MPAANTAQDHYITEEDYLAGEKLAEERHEYVDGQVYLMAGTSKRHNRIIRNLLMQLTPAAQAKDCEVFFTDVKVRVEKHKAYYYPDLIVGCEEDDNADDYCLEKPCLIVEVTSDSTIRRDYLEKALAYQSIPSLQAYMIVAQDKVQVDMLVRADNGDWKLHQFDQLENEISLPCMDTFVSLHLIYQAIDLEA